MRTSFHHQPEAQPPNGTLTAATSPDTPSHMPMVGGFEPTHAGYLDLARYSAASKDRRSRRTLGIGRLPLGGFWESKEDICAGGAGALGSNGPPNRITTDDCARVGRAWQSKMVAQCASGIFISEQAALLQDRHHVFDEVVEGAGEPWRHDIESVGGSGREPFRRRQRSSLGQRSRDLALVNSPRKGHGRKPNPT